MHADHGQAEVTDGIDFKFVAFIGGRRVHEAAEVIDRVVHFMTSMEND